jgi:hypothetical protein
MPYNTKKLKRDAENMIVPQYWNESLDDYEVLQGSDGAFFVQMAGQPPSGDIDGGTFLDADNGLNYDGGEF